MYEGFVKERTLAQAYHKALYMLNYHGVETGTDYNQKQKEIAMTMVVEDPLMEPMISRLGIFGPYELQQYVMEMLDGILDFKIGSSEHAWKYTYHSRMRRFPITLKYAFFRPMEWQLQAIKSGDYVDQVKFVIDDLRRNPDSRRAVISIRDNSMDPFVNDASCLQNIQCFIRKGKLDMMILIRSNDAPEAAFMNAFALIMLQKKIADELGIPVGQYTHRANSFHVYEKNYEMFNGFIQSITKKELNELTYKYDSSGGKQNECVQYRLATLENNFSNEDEDWKVLMEAEIPRIQNKINSMRQINIVPEKHLGEENQVWIYPFKHM